MPAVDDQQVFKSMFKALIDEEYSIGIDIERYQGVLQHALSKVDFSVGTGIYNTDMKIVSNRDINKDRKKLPVTPPDVPKIVSLLFGIT